jgi:hypothetical protein
MARATGAFYKRSDGGSAVEMDVYEIRDQMLVTAGLASHHQSAGVDCAALGARPKRRPSQVATSGYSNRASAITNSVAAIVLVTKVSGFPPLAMRL